MEVGGNDMVAIDTLPIDTFDKILISPESQLVCHGGTSNFFSLVSVHLLMMTK